MVLAHLSASPKASYGGKDPGVARFQANLTENETESLFQASFPLDQFGRQLGLVNNESFVCAAASKRKF